MVVMIVEPNCKWNCIAGVLVNDDYEMASCPFHDGISVNGKEVRTEKKPIQKEK
jgi:hypothetical protein